MVSQKDEENLGHNEKWNMYELESQRKKKENVTGQYLKNEWMIIFKLMTDIKNMHYRLKANLTKSKFHLGISKTMRIILKAEYRKK